MLLRVPEVHVPAGSTVGVGRGTRIDNGASVWFGGDHRPMVTLAGMVAQARDVYGDEGYVDAAVEDWQTITDMSLVCETLDEHDFQAEDIADGVVGGGAAHVIAIYCSRCDLPGGPEDIEEEPE